jgi:hypothetical protein
MPVRSWVRKLIPRPAANPIRNAAPGGHLAVEHLEDRTLLTTLQYVALTDTPLTLRQEGGELRVVETDDITNVLASEPLAAVTDVLVLAGTTNVTLTIDASVQPVLNGILFTGGSGANTLVGPNADNTWRVTGDGAGTLGTSFVSFTNVEGLTGGTGSDVFRFVGAGRVTGTVAGGGGTNTLDYTSAAPATVDLRDQTATGTGGFSGIGHVVGSGAGTDTVVGPTGDTTWVLTGANRGDVAGLNFSGFENLTGGPDADVFRFEAGGQVAGTVAGGGGDNTLDYSPTATPATVNLATAAATGTGGFSGMNRVVGSGSGDDTLVGPAGGATWTLTGANLGTVGAVSFSAVENLTGGAGNDTFRLEATGRVTGAVVGGGGANTVDYSARPAGVTVNLATGAATDTGGVTGITDLVGSGGNGDTIIGPAAGATWTLTAANQGAVAVPVPRFTVTGEVRVE